MASHQFMYYQTQQGTYVTHTAYVGDLGIVDVDGQMTR